MELDLFHEGDKIEVRKLSSGDCDAVIWYPASVIGSSSGRLHVKYEMLIDSGTDFVAVEDVRPSPPQLLHMYFKVGDQVEGFCKEKKGWRKGIIDEILENYNYAVLLEGEELGNFAEMEGWRLRPFRVWDGGGDWVPPFSPQQKSQKPSEAKVPARGLILKIKCSGKSSQSKFNEGMLVEVKSNEDGFRGSWYTAGIVEPLRNNKFLVEYRTLKTEDKTEYLREEMDISCIRPCPPNIQQIQPFDFFQRVDAWYNDGWWEGYIVNVINGCKYMVHFTNSDEMVFEHRMLRPRQEWTDGKWSMASKVNLPDENLKCNEVTLTKRYSTISEPTFKDGMKVEVKSDSEGYQGSWFSAVILRSLGSDAFLVEYQTLISDNESELLREKVSASNIRPSPPELVRTDRYKYLEEVDAWYNDGWWVGLVSKVLDGFEYGVYFWTTDEELVFGHYNLRPRQDWVGGKWVVSFKKQPKTVEKTILVNSSCSNDGLGFGPLFPNRMEVEVKSDEEGYIGSWYPATIVKPLQNEKYLVEYTTLKSEDETEQHREEALSICIRPLPPVVQRNDKFKPFEEVDVWYNDGWWVGRISNVLPNRTYTVIFTTNEIGVFNHSELRPHQDWINGQWVSAKRGEKSRCKISV